MASKAETAKKAVEQIVKEVFKQNLFELKDSDTVKVVIDMLNCKLSLNDDVGAYDVFIRNDRSQFEVNIFYKSTTKSSPYYKFVRNF